MSLFPLEHETIEGVGRAIRSGQTSCVEVLQKCLDRIEEWEGRIKAWVRVDRDGAMAQAEARDAELADGICRGSLHGIPFGIKDIIDVEALPTAAGFDPWRDRIADTDAPLVGWLRAAGAVILGKTATTQFAWIDPPPTRNPWNLERTPGGSSSGSAAAVALGMCLGALGSQTGGSIIRPASFCGIAGYKPEYRFLSDDGFYPLAPAFDHPGLLARSVWDLRLTLHELIVYEALEHKDPASFSPMTMTPKEVDEGVEVFCMARNVPPRLLRLRGFFEDHTEPVMMEQFEAALGLLADAGAEIVERPAEPFQFEEILRGHRRIMAAQAAAIHEAQFARHREHYAPQIRALIEEGLKVPLTLYIRTKLVLDRLSDDLSQGALEGYDGLVTPATIGPAPDLSTTGNPIFNSPFSYLGWPVVSFPIGLTTDGLPLALQMVGGTGPDLEPADLMATAAWSEAVIRNASRAGGY
jgi:aspartyl-tRNA(Asn)/glutamyl-tRNA(Gln) amidotransferase subunit A